MESPPRSTLDQICSQNFVIQGVRTLSTTTFLHQSEIVLLRNPCVRLDASGEIPLRYTALILLQYQHPQTPIPFVISTSFHLVEPLASGLASGSVDGLLISASPLPSPYGSFSNRSSSKAQIRPLYCPQSFRQKPSFHRYPAPACLHSR